MGCARVAENEEMPTLFRRVYVNLPTPSHTHKIYTVTLRSLVCLSDMWRINLTLTNN